MLAALVGILLFALGGVALAVDVSPGTSGRNGPPAPRLGDPVTTQSEIQKVTVSGATGGTFTLTAPGGCTTAGIAWNATTTAVSSALTAVGMAACLTSGTVRVLGNAGGPYAVMFVGSKAGIDLATMGGSAAGLTPGTASVTITPMQDGGGFTGQVSPHGGYSSATNYCLQCHEVHAATGPYALMAERSVTATCATCHALFGASQPTTAPGPIFPGTTPGTTSKRSAYDLTGSPLGQHPIGSTNTPPFWGNGYVNGQSWQVTGAGWVYGAPLTGQTPAPSPTPGFVSNEPAEPGTSFGQGDTGNQAGLYCGSCHEPHGDFGQAINTEWVRTDINNLTPPTDYLDTQVYPWAEGTAVSDGRNGLRYLHLDTDPSAADPESPVWERCTAASPGAVAAGPDTGCTIATIADSEGQDVYLYGYKLLSAYPNHSWNQGPESWGVGVFSHDSARWCGRCHPDAVADTFGGAFEMHSHPTGCTSCHGNPNDFTSFDFPHTSTMDAFLKAYPDALCINCHTDDSLP